MRRILLMTAGVSALTLTAPGAALAHSHHHHHKSHAHHARVSFRHLGPIAAGAAPSASSTPATPTPATSTPATPTEENAGKVASYTGGVLTLTLGDGSKVSGKVTVNTRFECVSTTTQPSGDQDDEQGNEQGDDNGAGDDQGGGDRNQQGGGWQDGQQPQGGPWQDGAGWQGDNGPGEGQDDDAAPISTEPPCDSSALTEGAIVRAAELRIAPGGTEFELIELVG